MAEALDEDVFSQILSHIYETKTLYTITRSIQSSHPLFGLTLRRLCQLPMPLLCDESSEDMDQVFDLLVSSSTPFPVGTALRHLVVETSRFSEKPGAVALRQRLTDLFQKTRNLQVLDWSGGFGPSTKDLGVLQGLHNLKMLRVDCHGPVGSTPWEENSWEIDQFTSTLGPNLTHLELRKINLKMYKSLLTHKSSFASYHSLEHLALDLTQGKWDGDAGRFPSQAGATEKFVFTNLSFPAVKELELQVGDLTIAAERVGPMALINWESLETLRIFVSPCIHQLCVYNMRLFMVLPSDRFSSLTTLEIRDKIRNRTPRTWAGAIELDSDSDSWEDSSRTYWGLVPHFLSSVRSGLLPKLVNLWVNQNALSMPKGSPQEGIFSQGSEFYSVDELWTLGDDDKVNARKAEWISILRAVFVGLESLRVGFRPLSARAVGHVLECCSPDKLTQFGFQYNWYIERDSAISPALLEQLATFPKLTSVHLLRPRPQSQNVYRSPLRTKNGRTLDDISAIFKSNPNICHVGVGQNAVWERRCVPPAQEHADLNPNNITLVQDDLLDIRLGRNEDVPRFFNIGELDGYEEPEYKMRQNLAAEVKEFRNLLGRILPPPS